MTPDVTRLRICPDLLVRLLRERMLLGGLHVVREQGRQRYPQRVGKPAEYSSRLTGFFALNE